MAHAARVLACSNPGSAIGEGGTATQFVRQWRLLRTIYGGNLPTTPFTKTKAGLGPTWNNSLTIDQQTEYATVLLKKLAGKLAGELVTSLLEANQNDEAGIIAQRERVVVLKKELAKLGTDTDAKNLVTVAGGLDHVIASGRNVNILVLDTEVYSNTGGQCSKSTPTGAVAKFAAAGKALGKKDLGLMAMAYKNAYVATIAMGYSDVQTVRAFIEAEAYNGPSIIIAYSHCIAHGIDMALTQSSPERAKALMEQGQREATARVKFYEALPAKLQWHHRGNIE